MPDFLWCDARTVVREGLDAIEKGKCVYSSGWLDPLLQSAWTRPLARRLSGSR